MPIERSAGGGGGAAGGLTKLVDVTLGADAATITTGANAIAAGHIAIWVVAQLKTAYLASWVDDVAMTFNGDGGANYDLGEVFTNSTGTNSSNSGAAATSIKYIAPASNGGTQNYFSTTQFVIVEYDSTAHWKTGTGSTNTLDTGAASQNATESFGFGWRSTAAINQITFSSSHGSNVKSGSRIIVYGLS